MVSDLRCPECGMAVHPCSYDAHVEKCDGKTEAERLRNLLRELYGFTKSAALSGERLWCGCPTCVDLDLRIRKAIG